MYHFMGISAHFINLDLRGNHLRLLDELLFIDLRQAQLALLMVKSQPLLVSEGLLLRLLLPHNIVKHLSSPRQMNSIRSIKTT